MLTTHHDLPLRLVRILFTAAAGGAPMKGAVTPAEVAARTLDCEYLQNLGLLERGGGEGDFQATKLGLRTRDAIAAELGALMQPAKPLPKKKAAAASAPAIAPDSTNDRRTGFQGWMEAVLKGFSPNIVSGEFNNLLADYESKLSIAQAREALSARLR